MKRKGLSDADVSARVEGLSRSQVSRIRRGVSRPSLETALKLARLTKLRPEKLILWDAA